MVARSVYHNFLLLSVQELLAAVHISRMPASEQISTFDSTFKDARFSVVLQFYAAITKLRTSRPLLSLVPHFLHPVPASIHGLVRKIVRKGSITLLVSLLNCLYEAQDTDLCKYAGEQIRNKISFLMDLYLGCLLLIYHYYPKTASPLATSWLPFLLVIEADSQLIFGLVL